LKGEKGGVDQEGTRGLFEGGGGSKKVGDIKTMV